MNTAAPLHPRRYFAIRYCTPGRYALRVVSEIAAPFAVLAVLYWLLPWCGVQGFASWPSPWQAAAVAALCAPSVFGVALLRLRRKEPAS